MFYQIERVAEIHQQKLLQDAQRQRVQRVHVGQRRFVVRKPVGRFLVRIGDRLVGNAQPEPQVNRSPEPAM